MSTRPTLVSVPPPVDPHVDAATAATSPPPASHPTFASNLEDVRSLDITNLLLSALCWDGSDPVRGILSTIDEELSMVESAMTDNEVDRYAARNTVALIRRRVKVASELARRFRTDDDPTVAIDGQVRR